MADQANFPDIYVDGASGGDGSLASPYTNLSDINWTTGGDNSIFDYLAGTPSQSPTIHLAKAATWREQLTVGCSGTATYPIIITSYGSGADPIINGSDLVTTWTNPNLVTNGDFTAWAGDNPTSWSVYNEDANNYATESPAGVLNVVSNNTANISVEQGNLVVNGMPYSLSFDITVDAGTCVLKWDYGATTDTINISTSGAKSYDRISDGTSGRIFLQKTGVTDYHIDNIVLQTTNVWKAACTTEPHNVWFDGTRGNEQATLGAVDSANDWYWAGNVLYVYSTSDPDTAYTAPGIEAHKRDKCVLVDGKDYVTVQNLNCQHTQIGILFTNADNCIGDSNTITQVNNGMGLIAGSAGTQFSNNTISYCYYESGYADGCGINLSGTDCPTYTVNGNTVSHCDGYGIGIDTTITTGGNVYSNTITYTGQNASAAEPYGITQAGDNGNFYLNTVHDCGTADDHYAFKFLGDDNTCYRNAIYDNYDRGIHVEGDGSTVDIYYNLIYGNGDDGIRLQTSDGCTIYNNTFYNNTGTQIILVDGDNTTVKNNILSTGTGTYELYVHAASTGCTLDYNYYYRSGGGNLWYWQGSAYNWADYLTNSSQDANSANADPLMTDPASDDFTLQTTSPCLNAGTSVSLSTDYAGNSVLAIPDIGAYEHQGVEASPSLGGGLHMGLGLGMT